MAAKESGGGSGGDTLWLGREAGKLFLLRSLHLGPPEDASYCKEGCSPRSILSGSVASAPPRVVYLS